MHRGTIHTTTTKHLQNPPNPPLQNPQTNGHILTTGHQILGTHDAQQEKKNEIKTSVGYP